MTQYKSVHVPVDLIEDVMNTINENKKLGYRTYSEFCIEAIRRRLDEIKKSTK
jgi:hypothetical protein